MARSEVANVPAIRGNDRIVHKRTLIVFLDIRNITPPFDPTIGPLHRGIEGTYLLE